MSIYNILSPSIFLETYRGKGWDDLCCWQHPPITYDAFLNDVTETYNTSCLKDRIFSDYVTQLYKDNFIVDTFVSAGTLNASTGVVTFTNTTGGTVTVSGFDGFDSYWSANTNGSISNSGLTVNVGIGTQTANELLTVAGDISGSTDVHVGNDLRVNNDAIINDDLTVNDTSLYVSSTSGRTGAGTIKPTHTLTVSADTRIWTVWHPDDLNAITFTNGVNFLSYSESESEVPEALALEGTSVRVLVGGVYYYGTTSTNGGGYGFANGRGYFGLTWAGANTAITDDLGLVVSYGGGDPNNFAVYNLTGTTPALQVVGNSVMSGSTDLLNMFTTTATTINGGTF